MPTWHANLATCELTAALSNVSVSATVDDCDAFPSSGDLESESILSLAEIYDDGVTQADPEILWLRGRLTSTTLSIEHRGMFGSSIPTNWPIGSIIQIINRHEIIDFPHGEWTVKNAGWASSEAFSPGNGAMKFRGGSGPSTATSLDIDDSINGWDIGRIVGELAAGDLVIMKLPISDLPTSGVSSGGTFNPKLRIEFKVDTGGPTDQTGWWSIPIDSGHFFLHDDVIDSAQGVSGLGTIDFMKLV